MAKIYHTCLHSVSAPSQPNKQDSFKSICQLTLHLFLCSPAACRVGQIGVISSNPISAAGRSCGVSTKFMPTPISYQSGSTLRIMFFDCSSAFNTILPALLCEVRSSIGSRWIPSLPPGFMSTLHLKYTGSVWLRCDICGALGVLAVGPSFALFF